MILEKETLKTIEDIDTLINNFNKIGREFSCRPDSDKYSYPTIGDVIDEEQSVRWNREKVEELRNAYVTKHKELRETKTTALEATETQLKRVLGKNHNLSQEETEIILNMAYEIKPSYDYGMYQTYSAFCDLANMYKALLRARKADFEKDGNRK